MKLTHCLTLKQIGGIERSFVRFLRTSQGLHENHLIVDRDRIHPYLRDDVEQLTASIGYYKKFGPLPIPKRPPFLRIAHQARLIRRSESELGLIWGRLGDVRAARSIASTNAGCVYWERGMSWFEPPANPAQEFFPHVDAALCNSHASRRMLQERWSYTGPTHVCLNGVSLPSEVAPLPPGENSFRLGMAGRMENFKGFALALQTIARLRARTNSSVPPVELIIAGDGPQRESLQQLAVSLGIDDAVTWLGMTNDMDGFYAGIHAYLHPAVREPFGLVAAEALTHGRVPIVSAVDGLPEVVRDGETGICVEATASLADYCRWGGTRDGIPALQYDPQSDQLRTPQVCDPDALADAVEGLAGDRTKLERMSAAGLEDARTRLSFKQHFTSVQAALTAITSTERSA